MSLFAKFLLLAILVAVLAVYVLAARVIVKWILRKLAHKARFKGALFDGLVLGLAVIASLCFVYAHSIEPYWPEVAFVRIESAKLPQGTRPIRIVHISDFHSDPKPRLEERLPGIIAKQKPDIILYTGDTINSAEGLPVFKRCLGAISKLAPTFAVQGNWDAWYWSHLNVFDGTGAVELNGKAIRLPVAGTEIWVAGVASGNEAQIGEALDNVPPGAFTVFLYHYPDEIFRVARRDVDLYCAGHTHGGQVALPFYGALMTLSRHGKRFEAGLYRVEQTWLYVNRGIGMEGGSIRFRFCARPEVTVIDLEPLTISPK